MRWLTAAEIGSFISLFFLRLSVCIFLFRLIAGLRIWTRTFLFVISAINFCSCLIICVIVSENASLRALISPRTLDLDCYGCELLYLLVLQYGTQCKPLSNTWNRAFNEELGAQCYSMEMLTAALRFYGGKLFLPTGSFLAQLFAHEIHIPGISVCIDVMCALVPMAIIQHLEMEKKTKYALYFILGLAFVPGGMAIGKTVTGNKPTMDPSCEQQLANLPTWFTTVLIVDKNQMYGLAPSYLLGGSHSRALLWQVFQLCTSCSE